MAGGDNKKNDEKYNTLKEFEGSRYSGMKIGASHKWNYEQGEWRERKITPEKWDVFYETTKRRAGFAPEGSGAPVGTEYNWLIIAHQRVNKLDANSYSTCLEGKKFKVAHKRASKDQWSITEKTQRKRVISFLEGVVQELKEADENDAVPYSVGGKERIYGLEHKTRKELYEIATEQNISNRSKMPREELLNAIKENLDGKGRKEEAVQKDATKILKGKTRGELYEVAREKSIKGRSEMKKEELLDALKKEVPELV